MGYNISNIKSFINKDFSNRCPTVVQRLSNGSIPIPIPIQILYLYI
jgi:hypothetical protein